MATATSPDHGPVQAPDADSLFAELSGDAFRDTPLWMVSDVVSTVLHLYSAGRVNADEAQRALASLVVVDSSGTKWSHGATTRRWYSKTVGGAWVLATPPANVDALEEPAQDAVRAGLWALGVDPNTVELDAATDVPDLTAATAEDLLDDLIETYGD